MKIEKKKQAEDTRKMAEKAREKLAQNLITANIVKEKVIEAAKMGLNFVCFPLEIPVSLADTETAKATEKELTACGYKCEWIDRIWFAEDVKKSAKDANKNDNKKSSKTDYGKDIAYTILEVSWGPQYQMPAAIE
jgi:hypothetical protein